MHHAAIANRRQHRRQRKIAAKHPGVEIALRDGYSVTRPECEIFKSPAVFAKGNLVFGAAIEIIENHFGEPAPGQSPQVMNVDNSWRRNSMSISPGHL